MNNNQLISNYYSEHRDEIINFIAVRIMDATEAEDIVQDIFLRLLRGHHLMTPDTIPALVYTMARHAVSDFYRHRRVYEAIRRGVKALGFETVIDPKIESGLVVSVKYPDDENWDFEKVHDYCYKHGFTIYPGKISTSNTFRLCALGSIDEPDIIEFFEVFTNALDHFGIRHD